MVNNNDDLSQSITELSERIEYLQARCVSDPANAAEVLSDALENLQISLEELSAADEELMQQNEELIDSQEALKESEEKYRTIVETANEGIWVTDAETRTTYVNKRMADMLGYSPEEMIGKSFNDFMDEEGRAFARLKLERRRQGIKESHEHKFVRKDGSPLWVISNVTPLNDKDGKFAGSLGMLTDITERKKAEEMRSLLASIVDSTDEAIIGKTLDGTIISWNAGAEKIYGYSANEAIGKPISILIPPNHPDEMPQILENIRRGEKVDHYETLRLRKDGHTIYVSLIVSPIRNESGEIVGASTIAADITERRKAEEMRSFLASIVDSAEEAIIGKTLEGIIVSWNAGAEKIYGYSADEVIDRPISILIPPDHIDEMPQILERISLGERVDRYETMRLRKDGRQIYVSLTVSPIIDEHGAVVGASTIAADITERKRAEKALQEANEEMEVAAEELRQQNDELINAQSALLESEERYRTRFNALIEGFCVVEVIFDEAKRPVDYRFLEVNSAFEGQTGLRDAQGKLMRDLAPEHEEHWFEIYGKIALTGEPARFENEARALNRWYEVRAFRVGGQESRKVGICFNDITERKRAEIALQEANEELEVTAEELRQQNDELLCTQSALQESEEKYRTIVETANEGIWVVDSEARTTYVNRRMAEMLGYSPEEMIGKKSSEFMDEEGKARVKLNLERRRQGITESFEFKFLRKDGSPLWAISSAVPLLDKDGKFAGSLGMLTDITERKQADDALRETKDYLENLIDYANAPIIVWDAFFKITRFNHAFERLTGLKADEVLNKPLDILFPEESRNKSLEYIRRTLSGERWEVVEIPILRIDGSIRTVLWNSANVCAQDGTTVVATIAQGQDITERKQMEEMLRQTNERLDMAQRASGAGAWDWNILTSNIVWSSELFDLFGLDPQKSAASFEAWNSVIHPEDREIANSRIDQALKEHTSLNSAYRIIRPDGQIRWINALGQGTYDDQGRPVRMIGICIDITERKQMEMELWKARDELELKVQERTAELYEAKENLEVINEELQVEISEHETTEKELLKAKDAAEAAVEAKAAFLANMSHELRTPMNAVIGYSSLLLDDSLTPEQKDYVESIRNGGEALLSIINDILEFSRAEKENVKLECQPLSLKHCVDESLDMVAVHASQKGLNLAYTVSYGTPDTIISDHGRLRQILANLLSNAVKFTDNGDISVSVSSKAIAGNKRQITFTVKDTGIGMPKDKMDRLFKPFTQLEYIISRKRDGAGLGLAICKKLVELMGGEIWAESEEGKGSTFRFTIQAEAVPGKQLDSGEKDKDHAYDNLSEQRHLAILVAEDNPSNQKVLVEMLKRMGYRPDAVADGCEVLQALKIRPYDLVLMDIRMPEMDGLTATKEIRRLWPDNGPRVVAITAFAMEGDREKCLEAGMDGYIAKPIQNGELAEVLKRYTLETQ